MSTTALHYINPDKLEFAYQKVRTLVYNKTCIKIIKLLHKHRILTVMELTHMIGLEQPFISQNLRRLLTCNYVLATRDGRYVKYRLNRKELTRVIEIVNRFNQNPQSL